MGFWMLTQAMYLAQRHGQLPNRMPRSWRQRSERRAGEVFVFFQQPVGQRNRLNSGPAAFRGERLEVRGHSGPVRSGYRRCTNRSFRGGVEYICRRQPSIRRWGVS